MADLHLSLILDGPMSRAPGPSEPDTVRCALSRRDGAIGAGPRWLAETHQTEPERISDEARALARALRRGIRRAAGHGVEASLLPHGRLLFDLLLPPRIKAALRQARGGTLTLAVPRRELELPWALLHDGTAWLGRRWSLGVVALDQTPLTAAPEPERHRLLILADPSNDLPAARHEGEALVRALTSGAACPCDLRPGPLRVADAQRLLKGGTLLHYAGHADPPVGDEGGGWRLADGHLGPEAVQPLAGSSLPRLIFANACQSGALAEADPARALLDAGAHHVITTRVDLPDLPGADFARQFYEALTVGRSVGEALRLAREAAAEAGSAVWAAYDLLGDPSGRYFKTQVADQVRSTGVRQGAVLALRRLEASGSAEMLAERQRRWIDQVESQALAHGGRLQPGAGAVLTVTFGWPERSEHDLRQAAQMALGLAASGVVAVIEVGPLAGAGGVVAGQVRQVAEGACWRLPEGIWALSEAVSRAGAEIMLGSSEPGGARRVQSVSARRRDQAEQAGPLVGRTAELARLEAAAEAVTLQRVRRAVTVVGPAGVGKSRLVDALLARWGSRMTVAVGQNRPYAEGGPFAALAGVLRDLMEVGPDAGPEALRAGLDALLERLERAPEPEPGGLLSIDALLAGALEPAQPSAGLRERVGLLRAVLGLESGPEAGPGSGVTSAEVGLLPSTLARLIDAAAQEGPVLCLIEDAHWMPPAALEALEALLHGDPEVPVLIVTTTRPDLLSRRPGLCDSPGHLRLDPAPLTAREAEAVVRAVSGDLSADRMEPILARAEGNPLFLRELALVADEAGIPPTVEAVMLARVDRQPEAERTTLEAASVMGRIFWREAVERITGAPVSASVSAALARLEAARFIIRRPADDRPGMEAWSFAHGLMQEVLHEAIGRRTRTAWHGRAALWLSTEVAELRADLWPRVAAHFAEAGDAARAAEAWLKAAGQALDGLAMAEARKAFEAALAQEDAARTAGQPGLPPLIRAQAEVELADLLQADGDLAGAAARLEAALGHSADGAVDLQAERLRKRARLDDLQGDRARARARLAEALSRLEADTPDAMNASDRGAWIAVARDEAWFRSRDGDHEEALTRLTTLLDALATLRKAPPEEVPEARQMWLAGTVHNALGVVHWARGDYAGADQQYRCALAAFEAAGAEREIASIYNNLGILAEKQGAFEAAVQWHTRGIRTKVARGDRAGLARSWNNLGTLFWNQGAYDRARDHLLESIRIRERAGDANLALGYANLGEVLLALGDHVAADARLTQAIELCEAGRGPRALLPDAWRMRAEVRLALGDVPGAHQAAETALRLAREQQDQPREGVALRAMAEVEARQGAPDADARFLEAIALLERLEQPLELGRAYAARARHLADAEAARALRAQARALFESLGARGELARLDEGASADT